MKFNRRFFFGWMIALTYGLLTQCDRKASSDENKPTVNLQNSLSIEPRPQKPNIIKINPVQNFSAKNSPVLISFIDDTVPRQWFYRTPVRQGAGQKIINRNNTQNQRESILRTFKLLPQTLFIADSWPDFTDAINLRAIGREKKNFYSLFYTAINFDTPQLLRVCHGVVDFAVNAKMWVNGIPVKHGELIEVQQGIYEILLEVPNNKKTLATRFTTITQEEIEEVYQWQLSQWQTTIDMAKANDDELLALIKFEPESIRGKAGFFRVGKSIHGKWWFIDPQGKAFYHRGCTGLNAGGIGGRRAKLPPVPQKTVNTWVNYLKEWGFNAMGSWTTSEFFNQEMAFTEIIETYYEEPWLQTKFPDVWNAQWAENVDKKCKELCTPLKNNKMLLGYYLDNERGFMGVLSNNQSIISNAPTYRIGGPIKDDQLSQGEPQLNPKGIGLLQFCLSQNSDVPAAKKAWEFVFERYDSLENLGKAWQINIPSKQTIRDLTIRKEILISEIYLQDLHDFIKLWVEQYYKICTNKIRKYDPNHLILGCRWGGTPGSAILEVEQEWTDIVSRNNYRANFYELFDDFYQKVNRPILNGELNTWVNHYSLVRNPIEPPGGYDPETRQKIRSREAMDRIFSHPAVLGYTKYRWHVRGDESWSAELWNGEPNFKVINPLKQANDRSVSIATFWDNSPAEDHEPLRGQIFITLLGGTIKTQKLPPAKKGDQASFKLTKHHIMLGLICNNNDWDKKVYSNSFIGEIVDSKMDNNSYQLTLRLQTLPTSGNAKTLEANYQVNIVRNQTKLEGTYTGTYDQSSVSGRAIAYIHRPVTTVRY